MVDGDLAVRMPRDSEFKIDAVAGKEDGILFFPPTQLKITNLPQLFREPWHRTSSYISRPCVNNAGSCIPMEHGPAVEGSVTHRVFLIRHGETVDNVAGL